MNQSISTEKQNQQVANYWSQVAERQELGFWNVPGWIAHQNLLASGTEDKSWLQVFHDELSHQKSSPKLALSVGCGSGLLEREMFKLGMCQQIDACDLSPELIKIASDEAKAIQAPIRYFTADLNTHDFSSKKYDLIIGAGIFHHIENLEGLFLNLKNSLSDNGKLILYDYVGPSRFQWSDEQIKRCNAWLKQLPKKFKRKQGYPRHYYLGKTLFNWIPFAYSSSVEKIIKTLFPATVYHHFLRLKTAQIQMNELIPPHPMQFLVTDPSEAIRSDEILPVLKQHFEVKKFLSLGGTLAQPLFGRTVANFMDDAEGTQWASKILKDERDAILQGNLSSDFVALIAEKT